METNGVAVARHGLILSQDGATASRMLFKGLRGLFYLIFGLKISKLDHWTKKYRKIRYFLLWSGPVYFLLYGEPCTQALLHINVGSDLIKGAIDLEGEVLGSRALHLKENRRKSTGPLDIDSMIFPA